MTCNEQLGNVNTRKGTLAIIIGKNYLTEYVLILAFVAGVAYLMFANTGLKSTVSSTFSQAQSKIDTAAKSALN